MFVPGMRDKVTTRTVRELSPVAKARVVDGLRKGDQVQVAQVTGATPDYVKKVLRSKRSDRSMMARRIWLAADRIIGTRDRLRDEFGKGR